MILAMKILACLTCSALLLTSAHAATPRAAEDINSPVTTAEGSPPRGHTPKAAKPASTKAASKPAKPAAANHKKKSK